MSIILKPIKMAVAGLARFVMKPLTQSLLILGMLFSVVLGVGALLVGNYLMTGIYKILAVPCMALGCFFSGFLFQMFLSNYIFRSTAMRKSEYDKLKESTDKEGTASKSRIEELEKSESALKDKVAELKKKTEQLKSQRIDITSFEPIMQLALAEFDMSFNDVKIDWLKEEIKLKQMLHDDKCPQYIGILHKEFKAKFGLDMKSVKVRRSGDKKQIFVSGLKPSFIGTQNDKENWMLREIQTFRLQNKGKVNGDPSNTTEELVVDGTLYEKDLSKEVDCSLDLNRIEKISEKQRTELQDRIANGFEAVKFAEDYVVNMGRSFVQCLLKTAFPECNIEFEDVQCADSKPLLEFVKETELEATGGTEDEATA